MGKSLCLKVIIVLALAQGIAGLLRAFNWVHVGVDLFGQGLVLLPFIGVIAVLRGLLIAVVALLYVLFAGGALLRFSWARWVGLAAAIVNLLMALSVLIQGAAAAQVIAWSVIPLSLIYFLPSLTGRDALTSAD